MIKRKLVVALPLLLIAVATTGIGTNQVKAWGGDFCGFSCHHHYWSGACGYGCNDGGIGQDEGCGYGCSGVGYQAGILDAQYDIQNSLAYQPYGSCLPCHSQDYWSNFHQGYDSYWKSHESQESAQGSSINIYGNNNYVSTEQGNNQQQNPLQQLTRTVCGFVNCGNQQSGYGPENYEGGP